MTRRKCRTIRPLIDGCYAPDLGGTCSASDGAIAWSDGSRVEPAGDGAGLYGSGEDAPCVTIHSDQDGVHLTRGRETVSYAGAGDVAELTCPEGTSFTATGFQLHEFAVCRGLSCPD